MKSLFPVCIAVVALFTSCSQPVMRVTDGGDVVEEHYNFKQNGDFVSKKYTLGFIRQEKPIRGRYLFTGDSVYLVTKTGRSTYTYYARGAVDTAKRVMTFQYNDWTYWRTYDIYQLQYLLLYRGTTFRQQ